MGRMASEFEIIQNYPSRLVVLVYSRLKSWPGTHSHVYHRYHAYKSVYFC